MPACVEAVKDVNVNTLEMSGKIVPSCNHSYARLRVDSELDVQVKVTESPTAIEDGFTLITGLDGTSGTENIVFIQP